MPSKVEKVAHLDTRLRRVIGFLGLGETGI